METLARRLDRVERENRRMRLAEVITVAVIMAVVLGISLMGIFDFAFGAEPTGGIWTDREGRVTYAFLENHEFWFRGETGGKPFKVEGVWETGSCFLGGVGNLTIYVDTHECCLRTRQLGKNLLLSRIGAKGYAFHSEYCSNRVLMKPKPSPKRK